MLQLVGAAIWLPGIVGTVGWLQQQQRAKVTRMVGGALATVGALSLLPLLGMELAQVYILMNGVDTEAMIDTALALNQWALFGFLLLAGLLGLFLGVPLLALSVAWVKVRR